jgi:ABC-type nitrate/sulfonate/bicarbonate transport system substrate-binding protein
VIPWNFSAADSGLFELVSFTHQNTVQFQGSIVYREEILRNDPALVERFTRGTIKGFIYAQANRTGTTAILARKLNVDDRTAAKIYEIGKVAYTTDGTVDETLQRRAIQFVAGVQGMKDIPAIDRFFDFSLARRVYSQLKAEGWKP